MKPWILLRGLMREQRHWGNFPQRLSTALGDVMVITLDLPGNGSLHEESSPTCIAAMTEHCRRQLHRQGLRPPYNLLALSLGAMVSSDWCSRYPQEVTHAVLINTSLRPFSPFHQRLRPRNYLALAQLAITQATIAPRNDIRRERLILRLTSNRHPPPLLLSEWLRYDRECPVAPLNVLRQLLAAIRYQAPRQAPATAMLVLCGESDQLVNPACSLALAQQWQAPLRVHPGAGHDLPLDEPQWVIQQIQNWLHVPG